MGSAAEQGGPVAVSPGLDGRGAGAEEGVRWLEPHCDVREPGFLRGEVPDGPHFRCHCLTSALSVQVTLWLMHHVYTVIMGSDVKQ